MGSSGLPQTGVELVAANLAGFLTDLKTGNGAVNQFGTQVSATGQRTSTASQVMIGALRQVGVMAVDVFLKAGRALIGFGQDSLRLAGDFQLGMQKFQVAAGQDLDASGLEQFHDLFIQLGKDLPVSTSEVQEAATEMVKGGLDPAILAAGALKQNIQFAAAAMGGDLVGAAEISAKVVAGWAQVGATAAEKSELLTHATDLLTKAANASSVDVHELSLGLFNVQATAKNAGISLDDVTTVLAELSGDFASSSEAGNSMASFITRLHPTTKAATEAMEGLGLVTKDGGNAFYDAQGNFVGFQKASEILKQSLQGLNNEQRQQVMQTIFQKDAMGVAAGLAARGAAGYEAMAASLQNAMGVAQAGQTVQAGYNTALENAQGSIEALKITIGEAFLPVLTDLLNTFVGPGVSAITTFAASFAKMLPAILASEDPLQTFLNVLKVAAPGALEFVTTLEQWKDGITALSVPLTEFTTFLSDNITVVEGFGAALGTFAILTEVAGWVTGAVGAITSLGAAFTAAGGGAAGVVAILGGPVTLVLAAVALAVGALVIAWQNDWGGIQEKTAAVWEFLKPIFDQASNWLAVEIPAAVQTASQFWTDTLWPALQQVGNFIQSDIFPVLQSLAKTFLAAASVEVTVLGNLWTDVLWPGLKAVGSFIQDVLWPIFKALFEVEFAIASKVVEALAGLWQKVLWPALQAVGNYINNTVLPAFKAAGDYLSRTFSPLLSGLVSWLAKITGGFGGVSGAVSYVVTKIQEFASSITKIKLPSWLTPGSPTPWEIALLGIGKALTTSVTPGLATLRDGLGEIKGQLVDTFQNNDMIDAMKEIGANVMAGFGRGIKSATSGVIRVINSTADTVEGAFNEAFGNKSPSKRMQPVGAFVVQGFMLGIENLWGSVTELVAGLGDDLIEHAADIAREVQDIMAGAFTATAGFDRQKMGNITAVAGLAPNQQANVQAQLDAAEQVALAMNDPEKAAAYFKLRSQQILELAALQRRLDTGLNADQTASYERQIAMLQRNSEDVARMAKEGLVSVEEAERIRTLNEETIANMRKELEGSLTVQQRSDLEAQIKLLQAAQQAEQQAFDAKAASQVNPVTDLIQQIKNLFSGGEERVRLEEELAKTDKKDTAERARLQALINDTYIPVNDTGVGADLSALVNQLATIMSQMSVSGATSLPASGPQIAGTQRGWSNTTSTNNFNMPIYTNNTPAALQQSFALLQAQVSI